MGDTVSTNLRIVCISDTHHRHEEFASSVDFPEGDVLVYAGDIDGALEEFGEMLDRLPYPFKILVPGNHDNIKDDVLAFHNPKKGVFVLNGSNAIIRGVRFYGHPFCRCNGSYRPFQWMFSKPTIPLQTDVVITHIPPLYIRDLAWDPHNPLARLRCGHCDEVHAKTSHWGSQALRDQIERVSPAVHIFGHVHDRPGQERVGDTVFVNASSWCTGFHNPIVVNLTIPEEQEIPFRKLKCAVGRVLDMRGRPIRDDDRAEDTYYTYCWRLTNDNKLENSEGRFLSFADGDSKRWSCAVVEERDEADEWFYFDDYLYCGREGRFVLDVDAKARGRVILWQPLGRKNQKWVFL